MYTNINVSLLMCTRGLDLFFTCNSLLQNSIPDLGVVTGTLILAGPQGVQSLILLSYDQYHTIISSHQEGVSKW